MATSDFQMNDSFFATIGNSAPVVALCLDAGQKIATTAISTAPRDTNDYANSIHLEIRQARYRKVIRVVASDWKSLLIESKTGNLARALKAHGKGGSTRRGR